MASNRVILDSNLWISFLISKRLSELDKPIAKKKIILIFSKELIEEFVDVAQRPKFRRYFSGKDIEQVLNLFDQYGELVKIKSNLNICRDNKDNFLLNLAVDSGANFLITGDEDLLILKKVDKTEVITYKEFLKILK